MNYQSRLKQYQQYKFLVFIPAIKYIKYFHGTTQIYLLKSDGMPEESIENITKSVSNFALLLIIIHYQTNFNEHCLIKNVISIPKKVINLCISDTLDPQLRNSNTDFTLSNCLFASVKPTKNADLDKYKYTGYDIGFVFRSEFSFADGSCGKNVFIFGVDMSSSVNVDNKGKDILILGEGSTQGLHRTTFTTEAKYPIDFRQSGKRFLFSPHYDGSNSFLFVNTTKEYQFKAKNSEITV